MGGLVRVGSGETAALLMDGVGAVMLIVGQDARALLALATSAVKGNVWR